MHVNPRLPIGWSEEPHTCELFYVVYFKVERGDVYTCDKCNREWQVCGLRYLEHGTEVEYCLVHRERIIVRRK